MRNHRNAASRSVAVANSLTPREAEVMGWVAVGKTNAEVAEVLRLSSRTVQKHLEHVFEKLGVETRTAASVRFWHAAAVSYR